MAVRRLVVTSAVLAAATWAVCGCSSAAALSGPLSYSRSGGIAGVVEHLTIPRSGSARVSKGFKAHSRSFQLSARERSRLDRAVREAHLATLKVPKHPLTPDAFIYTIRYDGRKLAFDDPSMPKSVRKLVGVLSGLVAAHT